MYNICDIKRYIRYLKKLCHLFLYVVFGRRELDLTLDFYYLRIQAIKFVSQLFNRRPYRKKFTVKIFLSLLLYK